MFLPPPQISGVLVCQYFRGGLSPTLVLSPVVGSCFLLFSAGLGVEARLFYVILSWPVVGKVGLVSVVDLEQEFPAPTQVGSDLFLL